MVQCDEQLCVVQAAETGDDDSPPVRHAETPDLAREALVDAVILIFKAQVTNTQLEVWYMCRVQ